jgi:PTH1 family peptidyl-tRNA hydrolase
MDDMQVLVGLGNPGSQYAGHRHNIGFMALDAIARRHQASPWRKRFSGQSAELLLGGQKVLLLKPETFMNLSGQSVGDAMRFFKIDVGQVTVFHDELDLEPGEVRVKRGGGNAGHNGLRSISALCGNDYQRVRIGIGHPGDKALVHGYVLGNFDRDEQAGVEDLCAALADPLALLLNGQDKAYQQAVNAAMGD